MVLSQAADVVRAALEDTGRTLDRLPGRQAKSGLHEGKEFGPALRDSLVNHPVSSGLVPGAAALVIAAAVGGARLTGRPDEQRAR
jgi:hypothetical protein